MSIFTHNEVLEPGRLWGTYRVCRTCDEWTYALKGDPPNLPALCLPDREQEVAEAIARERALMEADEAEDARRHKKAKDEKALSDQLARALAHVFDPDVTVPYSLQLLARTALNDYEEARK